MIPALLQIFFAYALIAKDLPPPQCPLLLSGSSIVEDDAPWTQTYLALLPAEISTSDLEALALDPLKELIWVNGAEATNQGRARKLLIAQILSLPRQQREEKLIAIRKAIRAIIPEPQEAEALKQSVQTQKQEQQEDGRTRFLDPHLREGYAVVASADHTKIITVSGDLLEVFDLESQFKLAEVSVSKFRGVKRFISAVLSPNGRTLLVETIDKPGPHPCGYLFLYDLKRKRILRKTQKTFGRGVKDLKFSQDGRLILVRNDANKVTIYDLNLKTIYHSKRREVVMAVAARLSSFRLAVCAGFEDYFWVADISKNKKIDIAGNRFVKTEVAKFPTSLRVRLSPNGYRIAMSSGLNTVIRDVIDPKIAWQIDRPMVTEDHFLTEDIYRGVKSNADQITDLLHGSELVSQTVSRDCLRSWDVSPDGRWLVLVYQRQVVGGVEWYSLWFDLPAQKMYDVKSPRGAEVMQFVIGPQRYLSVRGESFEPKHLQVDPLYPANDSAPLKPNAP